MAKFSVVLIGAWYSWKNLCISWTKWQRRGGSDPWVSEWAKGRMMLSGGNVLADPSHGNVMWILKNYFGTFIKSDL